MSEVGSSLTRGAAGLARYQCARPAPAELRPVLEIMALAKLRLLAAATTVQDANRAKND